MRTRIFDVLNMTGNGIAYVVFGIIILIVLLFLIKWGYSVYYVDTHCTMVLGTRVCQ